jgi:AcrR family transcriptional regulator
VRLTPEIRRQQILDAALIEFSTMGFNAATTAKIASRVGTTQSNLYVHFADKDEIFESLLTQLLVPSNGLWKLMQPGLRPSDVIDSFIDDAYDRLTPQSVAVIRLLISEGHRIPDLIRRWHAEAVLPVRAEQKRRMDEFVAAGQLQDTPLNDGFAFLISAPILYAAIMRMVFPGDIAEGEFQKVKETHRTALHLLLEPQTKGKRRSKGS